MSRSAPRRARFKGCRTVASHASGGLYGRANTGPTMGPSVCPMHLDDGRVCGRPVPCALHPRRAAGEHRPRTSRHRAQPRPARVPVEPPLAAQDLHILGWWLLERVLRDGDEASRDRFAIAVSLMRMLAVLGQGSAEPGEAARETELRARLLHGQLPRDEDDWALARTLFDDAALELLALLAGSGEGDGADGGHPLRRVEAGADEIDLPGAGHDEE